MFFKWRYSSFVNLSAYSSRSFVPSTVCLKILSTSIVSVTSAIYINVQSTGFVATQTMFIYLFCCRFFFFLAKCFLRLTPLQSPVSDPFKDFCCSTCCPPLHFSCMELGDKARTALVSYDLHISQAVLA